MSYQLPGVGRIPLRDRRGRVRAYATVDLADFKRISSHRWYLSREGYAVRQETVGRKKQRTFSLARTVMGLDFGDPRKADHIKRAEKLNNCRSNLRIVTHAQNMQNQGSRRGSSSFRGVSWAEHRKKWVAYCCLDGRQHYLGAHHDENDAHAAVLAFRRLHMPFATD
jgi:hypothetical protein